MRRELAPYRFPVRAIGVAATATDNGGMLFFSSLAIAVASILLTQVAHRRAKHRAANPYRKESAYMLFLPVALVLVGLLLVAAVGASKLLAAVFFFAAFGLALAWSARTARA
jgi:uncharacterized membrane protein YiaA